MSARTDALLQNPRFVNDAKGSESLRDIAQRYDVSFGFVQKIRVNGSIVSNPIDDELRGANGDESGVTASGERYYIRRGSAVTMKDWREWIEQDGDDAQDFIPSIRSIAYGLGVYSNRLGATPKWRGLDGSAPKWPVIQPADPVIVTPSPAPQHDRIAVGGGLKVGLKCGDTQIGFRRLEDGTLDPFHDDQAMALFVEVVRLYQPDIIHILGDFIDMAEQGRFAQEASFANTTQLALNRGHLFLAELRGAAPGARIVIIEGNHDLRLQNFVETNAKAAFGLKLANMPESWPVMSLPNLLRLAELDIEYVDSYPAATDWDNATTRNIHGTKANSKGSTTAQYVHELPHVSTWSGHTHRAEVTYRTVLGDYGQPIESYGASPGVLCRTDGGVPSVRSAIGASGIPAQIVEDWQQGLGVHYFNETESWPQVYRIRKGRVIIDGRIISVPSFSPLSLVA